MEFICQYCLGKAFRSSEQEGLVICSNCHRVDPSPITYGEDVPGFKEAEKWIKRHSAPNLPTLPTRQDEAKLNEARMQAHLAEGTRKVKDCCLVLKYNHEINSEAQQVLFHMIPVLFRLKTVD
jgi:hypothetical protein